MRQETIVAGGELLVTGPAVVKVIAGGARIEVSEATYTHDADTPPPVAVYLPGKRERLTRANERKRRERYGRRRG